jgi:hypothetical protein
MSVGRKRLHFRSVRQREEHEDRSMLRRLGLGISYFIAIVYIFSILLPSIYCLRHGCKGPGELDAFMPAFALVPFGECPRLSHCVTTTHQKKRIMALGFLASCNYFRDCSPRHNCFYRVADLSDYVSSVRAKGRAGRKLSRNRGGRAASGQASFFAAPNHIFNL